MKKALFTLLAFLMFSGWVAAQQVSPRSSNIFVELGGPGLFTFNYDTRFSPGEDGLGARAGIGYFSTGGTSFLSIPVGLNYLLGKDEKFFEMGINASYFSAHVDFGSDSGSGSTVFGSLLFGYRKQPVDGGFSFRAGVSPYFNADVFVPFIPYISFGYSF